MLKYILIFLNILCLASASGATWNYLDEGKDWTLGVCKNNAN